MSGTDFTRTLNLGLYKPVYNADAEMWGTHLNDNADILDNAITTGGAVNGPLVYTATGGTTPRAAQDRAADSANVLDFGADPTGVADSAPAINAAAAMVGANGRNKSVYLPTGTYRVNSQITLTSAQCLFGDGRGSSVIAVDQHFSTTATAVIFLTSGALDPGPIIRDIGIGFQQPSDQSSRANFKTLAAGGTSVLGGTGVMYPPAICAGAGSARNVVERVRISQAWTGITSNGINAAFWIDDLEISALNIGVDLGNGASGILDFCHLSGFHFWAFDISSTSSLYTNVFRDGQTIALNIGNVNGLDARGISTFIGRVVFTAAASAGWFSITNLMLDSIGCTLEVAGAQWLQIANIYTTGSPAGVNVAAHPAQINLAGGLVMITNIKAAITAVPILNVTGGVAHVTGGEILLSGASTSAVTQSGGVLKIQGVGFNTGSGPWTVPLVNSTSGAMQFQNNRFRQPSPGDVGGLLIAADNVAHAVSGNFWNGWKWIAPGPLGSYGFDGPSTPFGTGYSGDVALTGANTGNLLINAGAGTTREVHLQAGGQTVFNAKGAGGAIANYIEALSADAGGTTWLLGVGSDTNVQLGLAGQGTGGVKFGSGPIGFNNTTPIVKPTVAGAWAGNTAGKALSAALAAYGLITDSTTA